MERLSPALGEAEAALDVVNLLRNRAAGRLRLDAPATAPPRDLLDQLGLVGRSPAVR